MKPSHTASNRLIEQTHRVWQPRVARNLTDEDARQIAESVTGFFAILAEWSREARLIPVNETTGVAEACHER